MQPKHRKLLFKLACTGLFALGILSVDSKQMSGRSLPLPGREDSLPADSPAQREEARLARIVTDAINAKLPPDDSTAVRLSLPDSVAADSLPADTAGRDSTRQKKFLDDIVRGRNQDSLVYDAKTKKVYIYNQGDITYQNLNVQADRIVWDLNDKTIRGNGVPDTAGVWSKTTFKQGEDTYVMDSLVYNTDTKKAKIRGVVTQEGEGYLHGAQIKKMPDNLINIAGGKYTTCDADHPHFYLAMTKAQVVPGKKAIFGPSYLVVEDVPIYFLGLPFGFFPLMTSRSSGFITPEVGEEYVKGFFLRRGGYYYVLNDYIDFTLLGGYYTLGSWEASLSSTYRVRYKFNGRFSFDYSKDIMGEKGAADYKNMNNFRLSWTHQQDPKFRPSSTFSASVNFSTSNYNKYGADNLNDYLNTQTNSSIAYSKRWEGTPFSFSTNLQHSQNSQDTTIALSLPNFVFNVSRIYPFRRKDAAGKQKWYEKIYLSYTGTFSNSVKVKENELFKPSMFDKMKTGMRHDIPVSTSFNLFKYLNISPSFNYQERWYFKKIEKAWDPLTETVQTRDTSNGFFRVYNYSVSASLTTTLYGMYTFGKKFPVQAIRHVLTPTATLSYAPDFGNPKYGFYRPVQTDSAGTIGYYSPYEIGMYGVPGRGSSAMLSFGIGNTLEMKVKSKKDTTGLKKIKLLDNLQISSGYNFMADSLNLSPFSISGRTTLFGNTGISFNLTVDPYDIDRQGRKIDRLMWKRGKIGRLTSASFSFGYSFNSKMGSGAPAVNNSANLPVGTPEEENFFAQANVNPELRRQMLASQYYDFSIPWNFGFNYSFSYSKPGLRKSIVQTLGFNGSISLTDKFGLSFNGGYDFEAGELTPGTISLSRDLHCFQMSFSWVPIGFRKSWSFSIRAKSNLLRDLKFDKRSGFLDNLYDD